MKQTELNSSFGTLSFGKDAEGKWGYKVGGADTVIPFSTGGDVRELYDALQYSGLVTEDMSYEQMLDELRKYFPEHYSLVRPGWLVVAGGLTITTESSNSKVYLRIDNNPQGTVSIQAFLRSPNFDASIYNSIRFVGTYYKKTDRFDPNTHFYAPTFKITDNVLKSTTVIAYFHDSGTHIIDTTIDISSFKNECCIDIYYGDNGNVNAGSYISLTTILLSV